MAKVLVILADGFEELEALSPIDVLRRAGAVVTVAGLDKKEITSSRGVCVVCDTVLNQTSADAWDAVVLPGGMPGALNLHNSNEVSQVVLNVHGNGGLVCAICASPAVVLAPLGVLNGVKACCYPGMESQAPGVEFLQDRVVKDKNIITARGAGCAVEFALAVVSALYGEKKAEQLASSMVC